MLIEENTIISEVTFGKTNLAAAMVQGSYVGLGPSECILGFSGVFEFDALILAHARMNRRSSESRDQTIANGTLDSKPIYSDATSYLIVHFSEPEDLKSFLFIPLFCLRC